MVKKIIISLVAFFATFIFSVIIFMPYTQIASKIIDDTVKDRRIDIRYETIDVGLFGIKVSKLATGDLVIDKLSVKYNPIGLLFKRISFSADSPMFIAKGKLSGNDLSVDMKGSLGAVAKLVGYDGSGSLDAAIKYNLSSMAGNADIKSGAISFMHPLMKVEADSFDGNLTIKDNLVTLVKAEAKGKTTLDASGTVALNNKKIEHSVLDIKGTAGLMGMNMNFRLAGTFITPKFITN